MRAAWTPTSSTGNVKLGAAASGSFALIERRPTSLSLMKSESVVSAALPVRSSFAVTFTSDPLRATGG